MSSCPKLRIEGFTDAWEQRKLGDLLEKYEDPVETPHNGYFRLGIRSHAKGTFHSFVEPGKELETAKMHRVASDKFILNITFAWEHAVAITDSNDAGKLVSHRFPQFSFTSRLKPNFFKFLMLDRKFREYLELCSPGGAGRNRVLSVKDMMKYLIKLPSVEEQKKIGAFFENLDNLITLHQRKSDALKNAKKYFLKNMFPSEGEKFPKLRLEGFTDAWEQRKLESVVNTVDTGKSKFDKEGSSGEYPILGSTSVIGYDDKYDYEGDFILTARVGANAGSLYRHAGKVKISDNTVFIQASQNIEFLYHLLTQFDIKRLSFGTGQPLVKASELKNLELMMPANMNEQIKIGDFFKQLDNLITLHQRKCDALKNAKKFFLQNMFV